MSNSNGMQLLVTADERKIVLNLDPLTDFLTRYKSDPQNLVYELESLKDMLMDCTVESKPATDLQKSYQLINNLRVLFVEMLEE